MVKYILSELCLKVMKQNSGLRNFRKSDEFDLLLEWRLQRNEELVQLNLWLLEHRSKAYEEYSIRRAEELAQWVIEYVDRYPRIERIEY